MKYLFWLLRFHLFPICAIVACIVFIGWSQNWEQIQTFAKTVKTLHADFSQVKHMKILAKPLVSRGHFSFSAPQSLRWEYFSPIRSVLLMHDGNIKKYIRISNKFVMDSSTNLQAMRIVTQEISKWLAGRFNDNPDFIAELKNRRTTTITLVPGNKSLMRMIQRIVIRLSRKPGVITSITIYETKDTYTILKFSNVVLNKKIDLSVFQKI